MAANRKMVSDGLGPVLGESLNSFIYRVLVRTGYRNFSTVLTSYGWVIKPSVPFEARKEFEIFDSSELLKLFERSIVYNQKISIFHRHFEHLLVPDNNTQSNQQKTTSFREVFYPMKRKGSAGQSAEISFCNKCIQDQIKQHGFAFFKLEWEHEARCLSHSKRLLKLGHTSSLAQIVNNIQQVLKGKIPLLSIEVQKNLHKLSIGGRSGFSFMATKFAPCAQKAVVKYLTNNSNYYPAGYNELVDYKLLNDIDRVLLGKWRLRKFINMFIEDFYEEATENDYDGLMTFLNAEMELVKVYYEDDIVRTGERWLVKNKNINCHKCAFSLTIGTNECPASKLILKWRDYPLEDRLVSIDATICDKKIGELDYQIYLHQNLQG